LPPPTPRPHRADKRSRDDPWALKRHQERFERSKEEEEEEEEEGSGGEEAPRVILKLAGFEAWEAEQAAALAPPLRPIKGMVQEINGLINRQRVSRGARRKTRRSWRWCAHTAAGGG